jgi:hypothetical protein
MSAEAKEFPFPVPRNHKTHGASRATPRPSPDSQGEQDNQMGPRNSDETATVLEAIHALTLEFKANRIATESQQAKKQPVNWFTTTVAIVALLGSGINWLGSSSMAVGGAQQTIYRLSEDVKIEREARIQLQTRFDRLRDLYMVEFGADPEDPNTKVTRKRK